MKISKIALAVALALPTAAMAVPHEEEALLESWKPTTDFGASWSHSRIDSKSAYDIGQFGQGVIVGVIDSGVSNHSEFAGRLLAGHSYITGRTGTQDDTGHGTHVAGIIAAAANNSGMMGVAAGATILPVKVFGATGGASLPNVWNGAIRAVDSGARIINLSLGWSSPWSADASHARQVVGKGALVVAAAGNNGGANPLYPARYAKETWANGQIIAVGAVNSNNVIASWSNRAGDTMHYFLVAPGVNITSTHNNGGYAGMSGTSMAAPHVAGAAALLMGHWPKLTAKETADILLSTATDLGDRGTDAVYGRGLLNVQRALAPVGTMALATKNGRTTTVQNGIVRVTGTAFGAVGTASAKGKLTTSFTDSYGRNYDYNPAANMAPTSIGLSTRMDALFNDSAAAEGQAPMASGMALRYLPSPTEAIGVSTVATSPYLGFASGALSGTTPLGTGGWKLGFAAGLAGPTEITQNAATLGYNAGGWNLTGGVVLERNGFMGSNLSEGALGMGSGTSVFLSADKAWNLGNGWKSNLSASYGVTISDKTDGMVLGVSDVHGVSMNAGLERGSAFTRGDKLSLSAGIPLKVVKGGMNVETARYDRNGDVSFNKQSVNLADAATELAVSMRYLMPTGKDSKAALSFGGRFNANQVEGATEHYAMLGWNTKF